MGGAWSLTRVARSGDRGAGRRGRGHPVHDGAHAAAAPRRCSGSASRSSGGPGGGGCRPRPRPDAGGWRAPRSHRLLLARLRSEMQWQVARLSIPGALGRGVRLGLPVAAIIAATVPVWGMSWYFDTENWAAGIYNSWAETRTDDWREAMVSAVRARKPQAGARPRGLLASRRQARRRRPVLVHRHRRHRRRRRLAARPARSAPHRRRARRCPLRRRVLRRGLSDRRDARLREQVLAAVQGRHQAGVRDSRQPRLVRCARGVQRDVPDAGGRARRHRRAGRRRPEHQHDHRRPHRSADRDCRPTAHGVRRAHRLPACAVLRRPDRRFRADRGRHRHRQAGGPRAGTLARRRAGARHAAR